MILLRKTIPKTDKNCQYGDPYHDEDLELTISYRHEDQTLCADAISECGDLSTARNYFGLYPRDCTDMIDATHRLNAQGVRLTTNDILQIKAGLSSN